MIQKLEILDENLNKLDEINNMSFSFENFKEINSQIEKILVDLKSNEVTLKQNKFSQEYKKPPEVISSMIEAEPQPTLNFNNNGDLALMLRRDGYKSIEDLAIEELRIGGTRIDPVRYTSSRMTSYNSFSLLDIKIKPKE